MMHKYSNYFPGLRESKAIRALPCKQIFLLPTFLNTSDSADKGPEEHLVSGLESGNVTNKTQAIYLSFAKQASNT